jgi:hypothetical protein
MVINIRYIILVTYLLIGNIYEFSTTLLIVLNWQIVDKLVILT